MTRWLCIFRHRWGLWLGPRETTCGEMAYHRRCLRCGLVEEKDRGGQ